MIYPDCDEQPVANNTIQFRWLVEIQQNIDDLFANDLNVFVADPKLLQMGLSVEQIADV